MADSTQEKCTSRPKQKTANKMLNAIEFFALLGSPARTFARLLLFSRYLILLPSGHVWPKGDFGRARYGPSYRFKPWLLFDLDELERLEEVLNYGSDADLMDLRKSYTDSFNMVAVVGALLAQIPVSAFSLPELDQTHYFARGCFVLAMMTSLFSVFFTCFQQRALGFLQQPLEIRAWLSNGLRYTNHRGDCVFQSSYSAHQFLQLPYELLGMSITLFMLAFSIYLGSALTRHVKLNVNSLGESTGNLGVLIAFLVCSMFALGLFGQLLGGKDLETARCVEEMQLHAFGPGTLTEKIAPVMMRRRSQVAREVDNGETLA